MSPRRTARHIVAGLLVAGAAVPAAAGAASKLPGIVPSWGGSAEVRPRLIQISGDASLFYAGRKSKSGRATSLKWTSYTSTSAVATGYQWVDDCDPNCAEGTYHLDGPLTLRFSKVSKGRFTRLTVTGGSDQTGRKSTTVLRLTGTGKQQGWG